MLWHHGCFGRETGPRARQHFFRVPLLCERPAKTNDMQTRTRRKFGFSSIVSKIPHSRFCQIGVMCVCVQVQPFSADKGPWGIILRLPWLTPEKFSPRGSKMPSPLCLEPPWSGAHRGGGHPNFSQFLKKLKNVCTPENDSSQLSSTTFFHFFSSNQQLPTGAPLKCTGCAQLWTMISNRDFLKPNPGGPRGGGSV